MEKEEIAVKVTNVTKDIKKTKVLNNINLTVKKGQAYGIIGRNGSGKSMLFKAICGLINITDGEIVVFDKSIKNGNFPDKLGMIIEHPGFLPQYSALKNLQILASINNAIDDSKIKETIALVGLDPNNTLPIKKYSLGMKQRLGIAQALMEDPKLLVLDEPMNGLDSKGVEEIRKILLNLKSQSVTILLASHMQDDIDEICDHVYNMENGFLTEIK
ncbi:ATP-binding cassette domain-containing protein [Inconstantimicrobium mannanitabidum]|uniref:Multidrug ABC transporter ATP-binding protein n=1 Tax=Inconstantimicrobium mannanitabidum TaxID=1604901 RepID=A0ACB5RGF7_9CLOT|nr:ATP-binding cassette domain-containing protein [Clostridium sp. TW13]GKX68175.1 multidrug ABC transporter ATP-binding protein [Clostridium sp. TW13]